MTGGQWRAFEEDVFWTEIVRQATAESGHAKHPTKTQLENLIPHMVEELKRRGHSAPRTYTATSLYGHWHKNAIQQDYSPHAGHHVVEYLKRYEAAGGKVNKDTNRAPKREAAPSPQTDVAAQQVKLNRVFPIHSLDYLKRDIPHVDPDTILPHPFIKPQPEDIRYAYRPKFNKRLVPADRASIGELGQGYGGSYHTGFPNRNLHSNHLPDLMLQGPLGDPMDGSYSVYADELSEQCKPHPNYHEGGQAIPGRWPPLPSHVVTFTANDMDNEPAGPPITSPNSDQLGQRGRGTGSGFTQQQHPQ